MKNNPLVSVIIPCYNYGKYLPESIDSVFSQTYQNIELIIINDGSTDNTEEVAKEYIARYLNLQYIRQENKGIIATRNRCLQEAKGKYLIMLDADDLLDENYIQETVKVAEQKNLDIVYTNMKSFGLENHVTSFSEFSIEELKNRNYIHISSLIRTKEAKKYKFDRELDNKTHEDWDFFLNMCLSGATAELCETTFLKYRIHGQGRNNRAESDKGKLDFISTYLYILKKYDMETKHLSGKLIGEWYIVLYKNLESYTKALRDMQQEKQRILEEKNMILGSKSYRLARKISKIYGVRYILKRLFIKK
ncbi:MAG TPA: glycosyltransferase family 2 protein [Patescibacteria group bacterium]|nr:glycosyltransferase family 2 protein [Patescibacteria group bacterium]